MTDELARSRTLFAADDELDEVMRARIRARLAPVLTPAVPVRRPRRWLAIDAGAAALAVVAFVAWWHRGAPAQQLVAPSDGVLTVPLGRIRTRHSSGRLA